MALPSSQARGRLPTGRFAPGGAPPAAERFWLKVDKNNGPVHPLYGRCWEWTGALKSGYGWFSYNGRPRKASRVAWILDRGSLAAGLCVLHKCDNPKCVRAAHLFTGTILDNSRDMHAKGRNAPPPRGSENRAKTACPQGHAYTAENTLTKRGKRHCRECIKLYRRAKWQRYLRGEHPTGR